MVKVLLDHSDILEMSVHEPVFASCCQACYPTNSTGIGDSNLDCASAF